MKIDITPEIVFQTARSGGKGGQHVNKVETMVEGRWPVNASVLVNNEQKAAIQEKLANRITLEGYLLVKSQEKRTQLGNKEAVIAKMNQLVYQALQRKKTRIATRPGKAVREKRLESKKLAGARKEGRRKVSRSDY